MVRRSTRINPGPQPDADTPLNLDAEDIEALIAERVAAALAQYDSQRSEGSDPRDSIGGNRGNPRPCSYKNFMSCKPKFFFGDGGVIELTRWFEKTESVFQISSCTYSDQVKFTACIFMDATLSWWNGHVQAIGIDAANSLSWDDLKVMMLKDYCPRNEVQNLEQEFWNLTMEGSEVNAYTTRFTELAVLCPGMVTPEYKKIERYIWGLAPQIRGMVIASQLTTFASVKNLVVRLTDEGVRQGTMVQKAEPPQKENNKRKSQEISGDEEEGNDSGSEEYNESKSGSEEYNESKSGSEEYDGSDSESGENDEYVSQKYLLCNRTFPLDHFSKNF